MKKHLTADLLVAAYLLAIIAVGSGTACKTETPPPPPPEPTAVVIPDPTEVPTPVVPVTMIPVPTSAGPCKLESSFAGKKSWKGDCEPSPDCVGPDSKSFYYGADCKTR